MKGVVEHGARKHCEYLVSSRVARVVVMYTPNPNADTVWPYHTRLDADR
jgi:hypothetical protein